MASIIVVSGPNEGDYYPLGRRTMVIGRDGNSSAPALAIIAMLAPSETARARLFMDQLHVIGCRAILGLEI